MTYAATVLAKNPTVYHRLEQTTGNYLDSSPNGYNGVAGSALVRGVAGLVVDGGSAAQFSNTGGANSNVNLSPSPTLADDTSYTFESWVKTSDAGSSNRYIAGSSGGSGANTYCLLYTINGVPYMEARNTSFAAFNANSTVSINDNFPHHLVGVFDTVANLVLLYVDGAVVDTTATTGTIRGAKFTAIGNIGSGSGPFGGVIDEVAFYSYALTAAEVLENYEAGLAPLEARVGGLSIEALLASTDIQRRSGAVDVEALVAATDIQRRMGGLAVECLVPVAGQTVPLPLRAVANRETPVRIKTPSGWRVMPIA